ncbi:uncharacterized protein LOC124115859 isoform X2 [Haliotis rufescens]|uniref:uncharacterized protein LOC124115859 isoform X2 n=1 Tax=Haliotis rufescens TaxID=6454 RepID=UPI001EB0A6D3|nr:uncharacterized protein LOC124115859 isoform X2 [Haliotis rufescens]
MAVRLMLIFNIFSCTVLSQINDRVMAVVEENGVNATASKMSKESVEEKEDRQLFYIAMGILGGTAVLVLAVAVITYFTHRELPARVDIRKFTSYTSSA